MATKKLARKDVIRLARQKLWVDISKAVDVYEKRIYGERAVATKLKGAPLLEVATTLTKGLIDPREGDITSVEEIERILPPEPKKHRGATRKTKSPVSDHIRGEDDDDPSAGRGIPSDRPPSREDAMQRGFESVYGLGKSEEKVLILIVQSVGGLIPSQLKLALPKLTKRTIANLLTSLKSQRFIVKDENHGKFCATAEGKKAVDGRYVKVEKGAILEKLSESEKKFIFAIASKKEGITFSALTTMTASLRLTKRTRSNILTALKTRELIEKEDDRFKLTSYAREELKERLPEPLSGKALLEKTREGLTGPQVVVFDYLYDSGGSVPDQIANGLGYAVRTVQNVITELKALEVIRKGEDGRFELVPELRAT